MYRLIYLFLLSFCLLIVGCQAYPDITPAVTTSVLTMTEVEPKKSLEPMPKVTATSTAKKERHTYWFDDSIPESVQRDACFPDGVQAAMSRSQADLWLAVEHGQWLAFQQVYSVAVSFNSLQDSISIEEIRKTWMGEGSWKMAASQETIRVFTAKWGDPLGVIEEGDTEKLINLAWNAKNLLLIVPFEQLEPRLKSLQIDGKSVFEKGLDLSHYPLSVNYYWNSNAIEKDDFPLSCLPGTNRQVDKIATVLMTGVTALTRGTAAIMAEKGVDYPAGDILEWLQKADLTHISHEVSFYENCPEPLPIRAGGRFCAQPEYLELFTFTGVDIVELTGNHLNDWGTEALEESILKYQRAGMEVFGGGMNADEAKKPLLIEVNGNRFAFIGCNSTGPESDWATETTPGSAECDLDYLDGEIKSLREEGYLPIITFQGYEVCDYQPHSSQRVMADRMVEAGAVIVSGSQAHCPQGYRLEDDTFIHYGLGNLWFDQMDWITRLETLDLHVFYNGRHIATEILTAMLEDSARPRPMTVEERTILLENLFNASDW